MDCAKIAAGLTAAECGKMATSGTGTKVVLMNYDDIDKAASTVSEGVCTSLVLKTEKLAYLFESIDKATTGEATFAKGTYIDSYDHAVTLRIFVKDQTSKNFINSLTNARVVAIVENRATGAGGNTKYEVYGWDSGLKLSENAFTTDFADNVVFAAKLASDENSKEGQLPLSYFASTLAATETALAGLYTAPEPEGEGGGE